MPFIHNMNKHNRLSFSLGIQNDSSIGDRFNVFITRDGIDGKRHFREYLPGTLSTYRIQNLLDSHQFRADVKIELDGYHGDRAKRKRFNDYIDIELS